MTLPLPTIGARMATFSATTFDRTLTKLDLLVNEAEAPADVVLAVIASDPMLTAIILGQANATLNGREAAVTRLTDTPSRIGLGTLYGLCRDVLPIAADRRAELGAIWALANASSAMLRVLVRVAVPTVRDKFDEETLHVCALLHNLGSAVALISFPDEHRRTAARMDQGDGPYQRVLKDELGMNAPELGYLLARTWHLPPTIAACIRHHLTPTRAGDAEADLVAAMHVAHVLTRGCGYLVGADRWIDPIDSDAVARLSLRLDGIETVVGRFFVELEEQELYEGALGKPQS